MAADRLTLQQVAEYLRVEPIQISRLVRQGDIPFSGTAAKPLFDREEIDAWASRRILGMNDKRLANYHSESEKPVKGDDGSFSVCDMISAERIVLDLPSKTKASVLADVTKIADDAGLLYDPRDLLESLRAREELCSTGLGNGVAIIHPRHHDPYLATESFLLLARASHPVHFGAPDGKPTDIFFVLVCQDDRRHLQSLTHLCLMFTKTPLLAELREATTAEEMLASLRAAEEAIDRR